ncbi:uncharacterized protein LOC125663184 [Ostrea edulis]|uniref:uncharacterized protein LOC125663184 n=1 Tax=Ostrea edulis TaxID=37623 RepID=UPI0024AEA681|nr:uncharacterized protein LOC125663184 [Ostrea edulis]
MSCPIYKESLLPTTRDVQNTSVNIVNIPVCITCVSSGKHKGHELTEFLENLSYRTQHLQKDLEELETRIYPRYEVLASDIQTEKAELETTYGKLTTAAGKEGEILYLEITAIVNRRKSDIQEMKNKHLSTLNKNTEDITQKIIELKQIISDLKSILKSNDISLTSTYKSRNSKFRTILPKVRVTLPSFTPQKLNKDQLREMFSSLSPISINTEHGRTIKSAEAVSSPPVKSVKSTEGASSLPVKPLLDEQRLTDTIDTEYRQLYSVSCLSDELVWTCGDNETMNILNLRGKLLTSIKTKSGNTPRDIAVTRDGNLVYTDSKTKTINLVKNKQIQTVITLQGWYPRYVCSAASNADREARAVVVVNQLGKLRFRYTGHLSNTKQSFDPVGITTDSQSHILIADFNNDRIDILDQDGQFLGYIQNVELPHGVCVDISDNLFVAEIVNAVVKKIQYLSTQCKSYISKQV